MPVDPLLLEAFADAEERLFAARRAVERATADFHAAVLRLSNGTSTEQVAEATGLSTSRVERLMSQGAWQRSPGVDDPAVPVCSFCGRSHLEAAQLIAGPEGCICERCVADALARLDNGETSSTRPDLAIVERTAAAAQCSFCGKVRTDVGGLVRAGSITICNECLHLCTEIIAEQPALGQ